MSRRFMAFGSLLMLVTAILWLASSLHWLQAGEADAWSSLGLKAALCALAAGVVLRMLSPVSTVLTQERCAVCGRPTERGHTYCLDHLMETVNVTRDKTRGGGAPPSRPRPHRPSRD